MGPSVGIGDMSAAAAERRSEESKEASGRLLARLVRPLRRRRSGERGTHPSERARRVVTTDRSDLLGEA
jgi:hypothetical protein